MQLQTGSELRAINEDNGDSESEGWLRQDDDGRESCGGDGCIR
jgi:hypothetical protein